MCIKLTRLIEDPKGYFYIRLHQVTHHTYLNLSLMFYWMTVSSVESAASTSSSLYSRTWSIISILQPLVGEVLVTCQQ